MSEFGSRRGRGGQLGEKLMFSCNIQVEMCTMLLDMILKLREVFGAGTVALGVVNLQIVIGTIKVEEITQEQEETKRGIGKQRA